MSVASKILDIFGLGEQRESVHIDAASQILEVGERMNQMVLCPRCEREMEPNHECKRSGMSRRLFFGYGMLGASSAALAARLEGTPLQNMLVASPSANPNVVGRTFAQVIARAGDMFEVDTENPFSIAWQGAKTFHGNAFKSEDGVIQEGGLLHFLGQDLKRPDKWLRVHRGLKEMHVIGLVDQVTHKPVKYRIVRNEEAEKRVIKAEAAYRAKGINVGRDWENVENAKAQMPVDSPDPSRATLAKGQKTRHTVVNTVDGQFKATYRIGTSIKDDKVEWMFFPLDAERYAKENPRFVSHTRKTRSKIRVASMGNLHDAIAELNLQHPKHAPAVRKAIMALNPEYRRRVAPVRTVAAVTA